MSNSEMTSGSLYLFVAPGFSPEVTKSARAAYDLGLRQRHNPGAFIPGTEDGIAVQAVCKRCFKLIRVDTEGVIEVPKDCAPWQPTR